MILSICFRSTSETETTAETSGPLPKKIGIDAAFNSIAPMLQRIEDDLDGSYSVADIVFTPNLTG